ncbi:MAG TPA: hypothetical protein VE863_13100, partial [Pyrinomonadaceae bacterium]|nr:hypothetical protein [Pyrinomonadaceae bacterium]
LSRFSVRDFLLFVSEALTDDSRFDSSCRLLRRPTHPIKNHSMLQTRDGSRQNAISLYKVGSSPLSDLSD